MPTLYIDSVMTLRTTHPVRLEILNQITVVKTSKYRCFHESRF